MNKCAKFHKDSPSGKKVKFNLARAIELSETAVFVYNFVYKPYASEQLRWHIWPTFPLNIFMKFSQKMPLYVVYTMVQKSQKWPKTQIKGGPALKAIHTHPQAWNDSVKDEVSTSCSTPNPLLPHQSSKTAIAFWAPGRLSAHHSTLKLNWIPTWTCARSCLPG